MLRIWRPVPEPPVEPPEPPHVMADCGHEVYQDEPLVEWSGVTKLMTLCPDCFMDRIKDLSVEEVAEKFGCGVKIVRF